MILFLPTTQDATIYQTYPTRNTGLDEILEIGKVLKPLDNRNAYSTGSARILMNFDIPSNQQYPGNAKYFLNLRIANAKEVNRYQTIEVYPISSSWVEGSGYFYQDIRSVEDGVSWINADKTTYWVNSGSDYITSPSTSFLLEKVPIQDVKIDVTSIIAPVVSGSNTFPWNGLLLKFPNADESSSLVTGNIKFFSGNTYTIFSPKLEVSWNSQVFITGSLKPIPTGKVSIQPKNLKEGYTLGEVDKVYLVVRDQFPDKRFDAVQRYRTQYYLPSSSYFRIKDVVSDVIIYDYNEYSTINCDSSGSYIMLDTNGLDVNRYYSIDLKVQSNGLVYYPEFNYTFKVDTNG